MLVNNAINYIFAMQMRVRIDDVNWARHLDASKTASFLHTSRLLFLKSHGLSEGNCFGAGLILKSMFIDYKSQASFDDLLEIKIGVAEIGNIKLTLIYDITNLTTQKKLAQAKCEMIFFSYENQTVLNVPSEFIEYAKKNSWI